MKIPVLIKLDYILLKEHYRNIFSNLIFIMFLVLIFMILSGYISIVSKNIQNKNKIKIAIYKSDIKIKKLLYEFLKEYNYLSNKIQIKNIALKDNLNYNIGYNIYDNYDAIIRYKNNKLNFYLSKNDLKKIEIMQIVELIRIFAIKKGYLNFYKNEVINSNEITNFKKLSKNNTSINNLKLVKKYNIIFKITKINGNQQLSFNYLSIIIPLFLSLFLTLRLTVLPSYYITANQKNNSNLSIILSLPLNSYEIIISKILLLFLFNFLFSLIIFSFFILLFIIIFAILSWFCLQLKKRIKSISILYTNAFRYYFINSIWY